MAAVILVEGVRRPAGEKRWSRQRLRWGVVDMTDLIVISGQGNEVPVIVRNAAHLVSLLTKIVCRHWTYWQRCP